MIFFDQTKDVPFFSHLLVSRWRIWKFVGGGQVYL